MDGMTSSPLVPSISKWPIMRMAFTQASKIRHIILFNTHCLFVGNGSRRPSNSNAHSTNASRRSSLNNLYSKVNRLSLYRRSDDPYQGFGLRVVGQAAPNPQQQGSHFVWARVLWVAPSGAGQRAGVKVGDRVSQPMMVKKYGHELFG